MSTKSKAKQTERNRRYIKWSLGSKHIVALGEYTRDRTGKKMIRKGDWSGRHINASDRRYLVSTNGAFRRVN